MINDDMLTYIGGSWCLDGIPFSGITTIGGDLYWHIDGAISREDGPAVERVDGSNEWWSHNKLHRQNGPALEYADGSKEWFIHGKRHREDGPAIECADGIKAWWLNAECITTWKEYHELSTLSPEQQMVVKLKYGEQLK